MSLRHVTVVAPATTANLGPGFDVFGLALKTPSDKVTLRVIPEGVAIEVIGVSANSIPTAPEKNTAGVVAKHILKEFCLKTGVAVKLDKGIVPGMGLGSSAASAAAVAFGMNRLFSLKLDTQELIRFAAKGETASAGYEHADNVSAAICGNFVIVKSYKPLQIINLKAPENLEIAAAYPHISTPPKKTQKARSIVPKQVRLEQLTHNVGNAAALASGFAEGNVDLIGESMSDAVVEPERASLIPGYERVKKNALKAGASGVAISGAGPAMIAIVNNRKADSAKITQAMKAGFESAGLQATAFATKPGRGAHTVERER